LSWLEVPDLICHEGRDLHWPEGPDLIWPEGLDLSWREFPDLSAYQVPDLVWRQSSDFSHLQFCIGRPGKPDAVAMLDIMAPGKLPNRKLPSARYFNVIHFFLSFDYV
jgi:hypothetical protein